MIGDGVFYFSCAQTCLFGFGQKGYAPLWRGAMGAGEKQNTPSPIIN
jgi:hypothetical protein